MSGTRKNIAKICWDQLLRWSVQIGCWVARLTSSVEISCKEFLIKCSTICLHQLLNLSAETSVASEVIYVEPKVRGDFFLNHRDDLPTVGASGWPHRAAALNEASRNPLDTISKYGSNKFPFSVSCGGDVHTRIRPRTESCKWKQSLYSMNLNITENINEGRKLKHHNLW